jgi:hypothetical protein
MPQKRKPTLVTQHRLLKSKCLEDTDDFAYDNTWSAGLQAGNSGLASTRFKLSQQSVLLKTTE